MDKIEMTREEFADVYEALRLANTSYSDEEIPDVVAAEGKAWTVIQKVRHRAGLPDGLRPSEGSQTS